MALGGNIRDKSRVKCNVLTGSFLTKGASAVLPASSKLTPRALAIPRPHFLALAPLILNRCHPSS